MEGFVRKIHEGPFNGKKSPDETLSCHLAFRSNTSIGSGTATKKCRKNEYYNAIHEIVRYPYHSPACILKDRSQHDPDELPHPMETRVKTSLKAIRNIRKL